MENKWDFGFKLYKWGILTHLYRARGIESAETAMFDVFFHLDLGYSRLTPTLRKRISFYVDILDFNANEGKKMFGFSIPIGKKII